MTKFQLNINSMMNIIVVVSQILRGYIKGANLVSVKVN